MKRRNTNKRMNETLYDIYYTYDYCYGPGDDDWASEEAHEEFNGSWEELRRYLDQLRQGDAYNIDAVAREDYEDYPDYAEPMDEGLGFDSISLGSMIYKSVMKTLKEKSHNLSMEDIQEAFYYAQMKVEDAFDGKKR